MSVTSLTERFGVQSRDVCVCVCVFRVDLIHRRMVVEEADAPVSVYSSDGALCRTVHLHLSQHQPCLGLNIRGGREYNLGIYVSKSVQQQTSPNISLGMHRSDTLVRRDRSKSDVVRILLCAVVKLHENHINIIKHHKVCIIFQVF